MSNQARLYRSTQDRMFAGVCGGIAEYLDVDPTLVRLGFVALAFMGGPGPILYIVLMLVVPENPGQKWKRKRDEIDDLESAAMIRSRITVTAEETYENEAEPVPSDVDPPSNLAASEGDLETEDQQQDEESKNA